MLCVPALARRHSAPPPWPTSPHRLTASAHVASPPQPRIASLRLTSPPHRAPLTLPLPPSPSGARQAGLARDALAKALYAQLFDHLLLCVNESIKVVIPPHLPTSPHLRLRCRSHALTFSLRMAL